MPTGFEPVYTVLQTAVWPLYHGTKIFKLRDYNKKNKISNKFCFFCYLHQKVESNSIYFDVSVTLVGSAIVIKYHFVLLQTLAVCRNFNLGVSKLYFASNS